MVAGGRRVIAHGGWQWEEGGWRREIVAGVRRVGARDRLQRLEGNWR